MNEVFIANDQSP